MSRTVSSWLANFLGYLNVKVDGVAVDVPRRSTVNFVGVDVVDDPDNERTVITASGGSVADDIAKSAGTAIDRVQGINGVALETTDTLADGEVWLKRGGESILRAGRPCPPGWYDPRDYGALLNGDSADAVDDLPAFEAMLADMPDTGGRVHMDGFAWLSDTLRVSKPVQFVGRGGNGRRLSGFRVAPGKTALRLDGSACSLDGNDSQGHLIERIDVRSQLLIHVSATGAAIGYGIDNDPAVQHSVRVGDCFVASAEANPTFFYRATSVTANGGRGPATITGAPAWPLVAGSTVTAEGVTWTTEKFPTEHAEATAYAVGDRVYAVNDNRYIFECTTAGTSDAVRGTDLAGGDAAYGLTIGGTSVDGTVTWTIYMAAGILVGSNNGAVDHVYAAGFNGPGVAVLGGTGMYVEGASDANTERLRRVFVEYCGLGAYLAGDNCNGWTLDGLFVINAGTLQPTPTIAAGAGYTDLGGHGIHDRSLGSGTISGYYVQLSTGRVILKNGLGRLALLGCYQEIPYAAHSTGGVVTQIGGSVAWTDTSSGVLVLDNGQEGRGLAEGDTTGATSLNARLSLRDGKSVFIMSAFDAGGSPNNYAWRYGDSGTPAGWWGMITAPQASQTAMMLSDAGAGLGVGLGWVAYPRGYLVGASEAAMLFRGSVATWKDRGLRSGARAAGDIFESATSKFTVRSAGYKGTAWSTPLSPTAGYEPWGIPPYLVEPTTNTGRTSGGEPVWACSVDGAVGGTEPVWSTATPDGGTSIGDVITDGDAEWTLVGWTPAIDLEQVVAKVTIPTRLVATATTTATASQVIVDGAAIDGVGLDLPEDSVVIVTDVITLKKLATADGGSIKIESTWARDGSGAPAQIGTSTIAYNLSGASLNATTVEHVANGNIIELQGSPESADSLSWRVFRTQVTGED